MTLHGQHAAIRPRPIMVELLPAQRGQSALYDLRNGMGGGNSSSAYFSSNIPRARRTLMGDISSTLSLYIFENIPKIYDKYSTLFRPRLEEGDIFFLTCIK